MIDRAEAAQLIAAVAGRDRDAFRRLHDLVAPKLFGLVLRINRDRATAEDVLQDVFLRIWTRAPGYRPDAGDPVAWMASIARNRAIDAIRASPQRRGVDSDDDALQNLADKRDGERDIMNAGALRHCLEGLDETSRACVVQAYCEGFSREELAERHGAPVNTIKTWLKRGLAALKSCLDKDG